MAGRSKEFGFCPEHLQVDAEGIQVRPLPGLPAIVDDLSTWEDVENGWIYAPLKRKRGFVSGQVRELPYSARVFGLPKTHVIEHEQATGDDHLAFLVWALSFFVGIRFTTEQAGFLDATPIRRGTLVDFALVGQSLSRALELADSFWRENPPETWNPLRLEAAIHALFLGQYPQALQFERFIYLYASLDACYKLVATTKNLKKDVPHTCTIMWTCGQLGLDVPEWANPKDRTTKGATRVAPIRNDALHEALFMGRPLGFAVHRFNPDGGPEFSIDSEMRNLVCRVLVALLGGNAQPAGRECSTCRGRTRTACRNRYLRSPVKTIQRRGLHLCP